MAGPAGRSTRTGDESANGRWPTGYDTCQIELTSRSAAAWGFALAARAAPRAAPAPAVVPSATPAPAVAMRAAEAVIRPSLRVRPARSLAPDAVVGVARSVVTSNSSAPGGDHLRHAWRPAQGLSSGNGLLRSRQRVQADPLMRTRLGSGYSRPAVILWKRSIGGPTEWQQELPSTPAPGTYRLHAAAPPRPCQVGSGMSPLLATLPTRLNSAENCPRESLVRHVPAKWTAWGKCGKGPGGRCDRGKEDNRNRRATHGHRFAAIDDEKGLR